MKHSKQRREYEKVRAEYLSAKQTLDKMDRIGVRPDNVHYSQLFTRVERLKAQMQKLA